MVERRGARLAERLQVGAVVDPDPESDGHVGALLLPHRLDQQTAELRPTFEERGFRTLAISAVTRDGLAELVETVAGELDRMRRDDALDSPGAEG